MSMNYQQIFKEFCEWSPLHAAMVVDYKPWGENSIIVWLNNDMTYKVKRYDEGHFVVQTLSKEDIRNKYNL